MLEKLNTEESQLLIGVHNIRHYKQHPCEGNNTLSDDYDIKTRLREYYSKRLSETSTRERLQNLPGTEGEVHPISAEEIRKQLAELKGNKACGPLLIPIEV